VPLTIRAQDILEDHAIIYREFFGKLIGHVVRNDRKDEFIGGARIMPMFHAIMKEAGLVKEDGSAKFTTMPCGTGAPRTGCGRPAATCTWWRSGSATSMRA
jgi:hypothetical protein